MLHLVNLLALTPEQAKQIWPLVALSLQRAMKRSGASFAPIEQDVMTGRARLWIAVADGIEAAAVTYIIDTEWRRYCEIAVCAGKNRKHWIYLIEGIEDYAATHECTAVRIVGRSGWKRTLPTYRQTKIILEKALSHG